MKDILRIETDLKDRSNRIIQNIIKAQRESAEKLWEDVIQRAPSSSGDYISSIDIEKTKIENNRISTKVSTDLKSEDGYYVGRMIENGTGIYALERHIGHTKTFFESGYNYWYVPAKSVNRPIGEKIIIKGTEFYIAKAQRAKPHFKPALEANKSYYRESITNAVREALK